MPTSNNDNPFHLEPDDHARLAINRAIAEIVEGTSGAEAFATHTPPGMDPKLWARREPKPLPGLRAALVVRGVAENAVYDHVRDARSAGHSWDEIATVLGIEHDDYHSRAELAYDRFTPQRDQWSVRPPTFSFRCGTCSQFITDHGPYNPHPDDQEHGHADACTRHHDAVTAYQREHQD